MTTQHESRASSPICDASERFKGPDGAIFIRRCGLVKHDGPTHRDGRFTFWRWDEWREMTGASEDGLDVNDSVQAMRPPAPEEVARWNRKQKGHDDAASPATLFTPRNRPRPWRAEPGRGQGPLRHTAILDGNGVLVAQVFGNDGGRAEADVILAAMNMAWEGT
jgi:hypothetical protein